MASAVGSRLGHYAVTARSGEGGMGEVSRARDVTRLPVPPLPVPRTTTNRLRNEVAVLREEVAILREEVEWLIEAEEIRVFIYRLKQNRAARHLLADKRPRGATRKARVVPTPDKSATHPSYQRRPFARSQPGPADGGLRRIRRINDGGLAIGR